MRWAVRRLEQLYTEAETLLRAGEPRRAVECVAAALIELEGIRTARGGAPAPLRRTVAPPDAQAEALGAAAERLRLLARNVRLEIERVETERRATRGRLRLQRTFAARAGEPEGALDARV